jgi:hypothetical protein
MGVKQVFRGGVVAGGIGVLALTVGGLGIATAANGGSLVLGHSNTATKTTTLKDKSGTPLALVGKKSKPPLKVNSSKQVRHLNASLLGGLSASQLNSGSSGQIPPETYLSVPVGSETLVSRTGVLSKGTYYVNASALLNGSDGGFCYIGTSNSTTTAVQWGGTEPETDGTADFSQASETALVKVTSPTKYGQYCETHSSAAASAYDAAIFAIRVSHTTTGAQPAAKVKHAHVGAPGR